MTRSSILVAAGVLGLARGLDVEIASVTCLDLPIQADINLLCGSGRKRCTFGETATIYGTMNYTGVKDAGIEQVYATSEIYLLAMEFHLFEGVQLPLCNDENGYITADANNGEDCPGDGLYDYSVPYKLPHAGAESASWLATGWQGTGIIRYYSDYSSENLVGSCVMQLRTFVTHNSTADGLLYAPSAATTAGLVIGGIVVFMVLCAWCVCCTSQQRRRRKADNLEAGDDVTSQFRRMYEDDEIPKSIGGGTKSVAGKSVRSTRSTRSKKSRTSKRDDHESIVSSL